MDDTRFQSSRKLLRFLARHSVLAWIVLALTIEVIALSVLFVKDLGDGHDPSLFAPRYFVTRLWRSDLGLDLPAAAVARKTYIGDLHSGSSNWRDWHQADPIRGWRYDGDLIATHDRGRFVYVTTPQGFILSGKEDELYAVPKSQSTFRIAVIGGSTVMGQGARYPWQNLVASLKSTLTARGLMPVATQATDLEIINAGVMGYSSGQELLFLLTELLQYEPDLVVVYDGWNDSENDLISGSEGTVAGLRSPIHDRYQQDLQARYYFKGSVRTLLHGTVAGLRSVLEQTGSFRLFAVAVRRAAHWISSRDPHAETIDYDPDRAVRYRRNLETMMLLARQHGFELALFLQPLMGVDDKPLSIEERQWEAELRPKLPLRRAFYETARARFQDFAGSADDVCVGDLSQSFRGVRETLYDDTGHLRPAGNRIVADRIAAALLRCGLLASA